MTGSAANLSHYSEVLKTYYLPGIQDYLNHDTILSDIIEVNEKDVSGKNATIENHYGRSTGTGARGDGSALPTANYQRYKTSTVPMKYLYGRVEFTGPTIKATRDEKGSYAKVIDAEVKGIVNDLKKEANRMHWGCGYGVLARWQAGTSTTITLQKKYRGCAAGGDSFGSGFGAKYLDKRTDTVCVTVASLSGSGTFSVGATDLVVTAMTKGSVSDSVTMTDPGTPIAGSWFVRPASLGAYAASGAHRLEPMGLRGLVSDNDLDEIAINDGSNTAGGVTNDPLQGLDVSTYPWFKSIVNTHDSGRYAGQRALTLTLMQTMFDNVEEVAGKDYGPNLILTTRAVRREYLELCQADRRAVNTMKLDGGWSALDYNGVPLTVDNDAIDGEIYFLTTKDIQMFRMSDYNWMDSDGAILSRVTGYDVYEAVLFRYEEMGILDRSTQGVLCDLVYTKGTYEGYGG